MGKAENIYEGSKDLVAMLPKDAMTKLLIRQTIGALNAISATLEWLKAKVLQLASQLPKFPWPPAYGGDRGRDPFGPSGVRSYLSLTSIPAPTSPVPTRPRASAPQRAAHLNCAGHCSDGLQATERSCVLVYGQERAKGKPYLIYMTAGSNKFLRIYYGRVREDLAALEEPSALDSNQQS